MGNIKRGSGLFLAIALTLIMTGPAAHAQNAAPVTPAPPTHADDKATPEPKLRDLRQELSELRRELKESRSERRDRAGKTTDHRESRIDKRDDRRHDSRELHRDASIRTRRD